MQPQQAPSKPVFFYQPAAIYPIGTPSVPYAAPMYIPPAIPGPAPAQMSGQMEMTDVTTGSQPEAEKHRKKKLLPEEQKLWLESYKSVQCSQAVGMRLADTKEFNDYTETVGPLVDQQKLVRIRSVKLVYDANQVYGLILGYGFRTSGPKGSASANTGKVIARHVAAEDKSKLEPRQKKRYVLKPGENITEVSGKFEKGISRLQIRTSAGGVIDAGSALGTDFGLIIPEGSAVVAFAGGIGSSLQNIAVFYVKAAPSS